MWCTEDADGALLTFWNVVSGDIGDHWRSVMKIIVFACTVAIV